MDLLISTRFLAYEAWFFAFNAGAVVLYCLARFSVYVWRMRALFRVKKGLLRKIEEKERAGSETAEARPAPAETGIVRDLPSLSREEREHIRELVALVRLKISRGQLGEARIHVVAGLSIDKFDKDLNILLANLYELEGDFAKAELVYKDLIVLHENDPEVYLRLGRALVAQEKLEIAYEVYRRLLLIDELNFEALEMFGSVAYRLEKYEDAGDAARRYLRKYPANLEMLHLLADVLIRLGQREPALLALEKIHTLEPYNDDVRSLIERMRIEIEMHSHFQDKNAQQ